MTITIKQLTLINFKGIRSLVVPFRDITNIFGNNGTGKTSIVDAFTWLLFGKDSQGSSDFNIKTLDENNNPIPMLDHTAEGILMVDGQQTTLRRTYREKWTRRRGSETSELTGHETLFFINDVPLQAREYKAKIDAMVGEATFKLLTQATYFNQMKWQDRREYLTSMIGAIGRGDILARMKPGNAEIFTKEILPGVKLIEVQKEVAMRKRKLSDELKLIPSRIDEVKRSMPPEQDYDSIERTIAIRRAAIAEIESAINDQVKAYDEKRQSLEAIQRDIFAKRKDLQQMSYDHQGKWDALAASYKNEQARITRQIDQIQSDSLSNVSRKQSIVSRIASVDQERAGLRVEWSDVNSEQFEMDYNEVMCPTCRRPLDVVDVEGKRSAMEAAFVVRKNSRLASISQRGNSLKEESERLQKELADIEIRAAQYDEQIATAKADMGLLSEPAKPDPIQDTAEYKALESEIQQMEARISEIPKLDIDDLKRQKSEVQATLSALEQSMAMKQVAQKAVERERELLAEEKSLSQQISDLERREFAMDEFTREHMNMVEEKVNTMFSLVRFKMFNHLLNGTFEPTCECTKDGVPYSDLNAGGKIQAGLDIINTLSRHHSVYCPVFIDNRESVNEIPLLSSQQINMYVTLDNELVVR